MENRKRSIVLWSILALIGIILLTVLGINLLGKKENPMAVASVQDNGTSEVVYGQTDNLVFTFVGQDGGQGEISYELVSQKNEDNKTVDYFKLVSDRDNQIKVDKKIAAGTYNLTIRANAKGNNKYKASSKDITYLYTVNKAKGKIDKVPKAQDDLVYNGKKQKLISEGESSTGKFLYKVNDGEYSEKIPEETEAGIYTVYYKVEGDENHEDVKEGYVLSSIDNNKTNTASASYYRPRTSYSSSFSLSGLIKSITDSSSISYRPTPVGGKPKQEVEYTYDGKTHDNGYNTPDGVIATGLTSGKSAGTYKAIYTPDLAHCWNDGSRDPVMVTLTIKKQDPSIELDIPVLYYDGSGQQLIDSAKVEGGNAIYSLDDKIYTTHFPFAVNAGTYTVYYKILGDRNHNNLSGSVEVTINKRPLIIPSFSSKYVYNGLPYKVELDDYDIKTMHILPSCELIRINAGTYDVEIEIRDPENNVWSNGSVDNVIVKWTIEKAQGKITIRPSERNLTYNGHDQILTTSGLSLTGTMKYRLGESGEYSSDLPKAMNAGTYTVYYYSEGSRNYKDTKPETLKVEIKKAKAKVEAHPHGLGIICDGQMHDLLIPGETYDGYFEYRLEDTDWSTKVPQASKEGEYRVYYRVVGDSNHTNSDEYNLLTIISKHRATFIEEPQPLEGLVYSGEHQPLSSEGKTDEGTVVYSVNDGEFSSSLPTGLNAGTYKVTYKIIGDEIHDDSYPKSFNVTIDKAFLSIELPEDDFVYNGQPQGNPVIAKTVDGKDAKVEYKFALGKYSEEVPRYINVVYNLLGKVAPRTLFFRATDENHYEAEGEYTITIQKKELDIPYIIEDKIEYTGDTITPVIENYDSAYMTAKGDESAIDVGKYSIRVEINDKWNTGWTSGSTETIKLKWSIEKASVKLIDPVAIEGLVYTGQPQQLITAGEVEGGVLKYSKDGKHFSDEIPSEIDDGYYGVYYKVIADKNHIDRAPVEIGAVISPAQISVSAPDQNYVFDNNAHGEAVTDVVTVNNIPFGVFYYIESVEEFLDEAPQFIDAGSYTVNYTVYADHHIDASGSYNIVIEKADGVIDTDPTANSGLVYDGQPKQLLSSEGSSSTGTMMYSLDNTNYFELTPSVTDAGDYTVYYYSKGDDNHKDSEIRSINVSVDRKAIDKPVFDGNEFDYDENSHGPTVTGYDQSLMNLSGNVSEVNAGEYTLVCALNDKNNYKWSDNTDEDITYNWTINKAYAEVIIQPQGNTLTYNGFAQQLVTDGSAYGGSLVYSLDGENYVSADQMMAVDAGTYEIIFKVLGDENHYDSEQEYYLDSVINPGQAIILEAPKEIKGLTYTGLPQYLITGGVSNFGVIKYSIDNENFYESIPTGIDAGTYVVSYMIEPTDNYSGTGVEQLMVEIGTGVNPLAPMYDPVTFVCNENTAVSMYIPRYLQQGVGELSYQIVSSDSEYIMLNGDYLETAGLAKGIYNIKLRITAAGDVNHHSKTVTMNIVWTVDNDNQTIIDPIVQSDFVDYIQPIEPDESRTFDIDENQVYELLEDYIQIFDDSGKLNIFKSDNE